MPSGGIASLATQARNDMFFVRGAQNVENLFLYSYPLLDIVAVALFLKHDYNSFIAIVF